jgi:hypothetical protein
MKRIILLALLMGLVFSSIAFAQWGYSRDLYGTAIAWVAENFDDDSQFDGCTWAPDGMYLNGKYINWRSACNQHDRDYENGVPKDEADRRLRDNMIRAGAPRAVAEAYYQAVRIFGQSFYDNAQRDW